MPISQTALVARISALAEIENTARVKFRMRDGDANGRLRDYKISSLRRPLLSYTYSRLALSLSLCLFRGRKTHTTTSARVVVLCRTLGRGSRSGSLPWDRLSRGKTIFNASLLSAPGFGEIVFSKLRDEASELRI